MRAPFVSIPWSREAIYSIAADALSFSILARVHLEGARSVAAAQSTTLGFLRVLIKKKISSTHSDRMPEDKREILERDY